MFGNTQNKSDNLIKYLKQKKINIVFHYIPLHNSPFGKLKTTKKSNMINTNFISSNLLRMPMHRKLIKKDITRVAKEMFNFFEN